MTGAPIIPPAPIDVESGGDGTPPLLVETGANPREGEGGGNEAAAPGVTDLLQEVRGAREVSPFVVLLVLKWGLNAVYSSLWVFFLALCVNHFRSKIDELLRRGANGNRVGELLAWILVSLALLVTLSSTSEQCQALYFQHAVAHSISIFTVLLGVVATDLTAQLLVATSKIAAITVHMCTGSSNSGNNQQQHLRLKHTLQWVQHVGTVYRALLPVQFYSSYYGGKTAFSFLYALSKAYQVVSLVRAMLHHTKMLVGMQPTEEELGAGSDVTCPICLSQLKDHTACIKLSCHHTFCSVCLEEWLEKGSNSCPVCREAVQDESEARHARMLQDWETASPVVF